MKKVFLILILGIVPVFLFNSSSMGETKAPDRDKVEKMAREYAVEIFKKYLDDPDLKAEIDEANPDTSESEGKIFVYNVWGKVHHLRLKNGTISGRFNYQFGIKKTFFGIKPYKEKTSPIIEIYVNDALNPEFQLALIKNYFITGYGDPVDLQVINPIKNTIYANPNATVETDACATFSNYIVKTRLEFKPQSNIIKDYNEFKITDAQWAIKQSKEIYKVNFPNDERIKKDLKDILFEYIHSHVEENSGKQSHIKSLSKVSAILSRSLKEAGKESICLDIECDFNMHKIIRSTIYKIRVDVVYYYDEKNGWIFKKK